jgi:ABC-type multidrug transport system ATPase subunit
MSDSEARSASFIEMHGISKSIAGVPVLSGVNLVAAMYQRTAIVGPLLSILMGMVPADSGVATVAGLPYRVLPRAHRSAVAVFMPTHAPSQAVRRYLRSVAASVGARRSRVQQVMDVARLSEIAAERLDRLTVPQRYLVECAAAALSQPQLLVLDSLDAMVQTAVWPALDALLQSERERVAGLLVTARSAEQIPMAFHRILQLPGAVPSLAGNDTAALLRQRR